MSDGADGSAEPQVTFKVKTSGDGLHTITMPESATVLELKTKLATEAYENIAVERQRLIYSGRVMKNDDTLGFYKIKPGNTLHLVKSAASNHPPAGSGAAAAGAAGATGSGTVPPAIPANMAAGTPASNLLAGLTGARFAGHAALPNADIFGPDGGLVMQSEDELTDMMANPAIAQSVNEALNNPSFVDFIIENNPSLRNTPHARELLQSPAFRSMLTNPESLRMMSRMRRAMAGQGEAFPAPGATDTTPADAAAAAGNTGIGAGAGANPFAAGGFNPFLFMPPGAGAGAGGAAANPFAAFFAPPGAGAAAATGAGTGAGAGAGTGAAAATGGAGAGTGAGETGSDANANAAAAANPFAALFGAGGAGAAGLPQGFPQVTPEMMQQAMQLLGGAGGGGGAGAGAGAFANPFLGGLGGLGGAAPARDTRPPEEMYAEQLRQLNDMGFYNFEQNVAALRRSGGSVQGAIQHLLGD